MGRFPVFVFTNSPCGLRDSFTGASLGCVCMPANMPTSRRILVADGDAESRERIAGALAAPAHEVAAFAEGFEALAYAQREKPDLMVAELLLPDVTGLGLCRLLREDPALEHLGILVVTSLSSEIDRVLAFEAGVDDFLAKPFFARELASRAGAVLRRTIGPETTPRVPGFRQAALLHPNSLSVAGRRVELTPREYQLVAALIGESGRVLSRRQLIDLVWGSERDQDERVVDAHIKAIRRKLGEAGAFIETVRGVGYRYAELALARG
jgi:two-component system phosphate regulon response regulator PhoB